MLLLILKQEVCLFFFFWWISFDLYAETPTKGKVMPMKLDLTSFSSVHEFCGEYKRRFNRLDVLILNAGLSTCYFEFLSHLRLIPISSTGVLGQPKTMTEDGNEMHFQVHHLSHFLLTTLLCPLLVATCKLLFYIKFYFHKNVCFFADKI
jgi:NAD(P)-dependent dehydrogenase (short-subunit alcohol dehydrogenase family)